MHSPWVTSATVGIHLDILDSFSTVFSTSDTKYLRPSPSIFTSNAELSPNLLNSSIPKNSLNLSGFRASSNGLPSASLQVTASSVIDRKMLPLLHVCALGSFSFNFATVVPLPVPDRPCKTTTQPFEGASPSFAIISLATTSASFPDTWTFVMGSTTTSSGSTPLSTASLMPLPSLSPSS